MPLTEADALRAYARMLNTGDATQVEAFMPDDLCYDSQTVFEEITSREEFLQYMLGKLATINEDGTEQHAEMGQVTAYRGVRPCVILAQPTRDDLVALVLATVVGEHLERLDLCIVPPPEAAQRTGDYPG